MVAYFEPRNISYKKIIKYNFFPPLKVEETAQTEELMFQNVAYRPTVYKTGVTTHFQEKRDGIKQRAD